MEYLFVGSGSFAAQVLNQLEFLPSLVITKSDAVGGRGMHTPLPSPVKVLAHKKHIPTKFALAPDTVKQPVVVADFGVIIPDILLKAAPYGMWNIHPSLLPYYRGPSPIQSVLRNREEKTGVTIIQLDSQVDHGPILAREELLIPPDATAPSLSGLLAKTAARLIIPLLQQPDQALEVRKEQDHTHATYTKKLTKQDGYVPIKKLRPYLLPIFTKYNLLHLLPENDNTKALSEEILDAMVRAQQPWPGVWTTAKNGKVIKLSSLHTIHIEGKSYM